MLAERRIILDPSIFRAYDIRGIVGVTLTEEAVFLIGKAIGSSLKEQGIDEIVVARDGRLSGPALIRILSDGILSTGCHVIDIGMVPTPVLYFATKQLAAHSGVMLTGSHNPAEYNGLKMVVNGISLTEDEIQALYQRVNEGRFLEGHGVRREVQVVDQYIQQIVSTVKLSRPLKIVIDAGNGVAGAIAPALFKAMGCEVIELFCEVDGHFPNHHPDPSQPVNLKDLHDMVSKHQADVGLAFDGDADRLGVVTSGGEIICADRLLMLFAKALLAAPQSASTNNKVVYDVKCTNHLATLVRALGGEPIMWKTGHTHIKAKMASTEAMLGGEMSGHFFFKDRWYGFDDGLYAGARLLEILSEQQEDSSAVFAAIPNSVNTPELKIMVAEDEKFKLMQRLIDGASFNEPNEVMTMDGLRVNFAEGWGLVRPSNTTPCLVLRFEAINDVVLASIQTMFRHWMLSVKPDLELPF